MCEKYVISIGDFSRVNGGHLNWSWNYFDVITYVELKQEIY